MGPCSLVRPDLDPLLRTIQKGSSISRVKSCITTLNEFWSSPIGTPWLDKLPASRKATSMDFAGHPTKRAGKAVAGAWMAPDVLRPLARLMRRHPQTAFFGVNLDDLYG